MTTRVAVMSDIHGNLLALQAVAESLPACDHICVAGDLAFDGPNPDGVIDFLLSAEWDLVMGNTDRDLTDSSTFGSKKHALVNWTREKLGSSRLTAIARLPFSRSYSAGKEELFVVHANPLSMDEHLHPTMSEKALEPYLKDVRADILAFGHLHIPYIRPVNGTLLVDVSSVGHPKDHDTRAAYTIFTWTDGYRSVDQVRVPYDVERTADLMRKCGMPDGEEHADGLLRASY